MDSFFVLVVAAIEDSVVMQFSTPGRLRIESISNQFVLRCPKSSGLAPMSSSSLCQKLGQVLREAGDYTTCMPLAWVSLSSLCRKTDGNCNIGVWLTERIS